MPAWVANRPAMTSFSNRAPAPGKPATMAAMAPIDGLILNEFFRAPRWPAGEHGAQACLPRKRRIPALRAAGRCTSDRGQMNPPFWRRPKRARDTKVGGQHVEQALALAAPWRSAGRPGRRGGWRQTARHSATGGVRFARNVRAISAFPARHTGSSAPRSTTRFWLLTKTGPTKDPGAIITGVDQG